MTTITLALLTLLIGCIVYKSVFSEREAEKQKKREALAEKKREQR